MDVDYDEEAPSDGVQEDDEQSSTSGDHVNKSRITVRCYSGVEQAEKDRSSLRSFLDRKGHMWKCEIPSLGILLQ